jgi:hypothetical protein
MEQVISSKCSARDGTVDLIPELPNQLVEPI